MNTRHFARTRAGFTQIELVVVLGIMGVVSALVYPKAQKLFGASGLASARSYVQTYLTTARATAIQRGRTARFYLQNNTITVRVDTLGNGTFVNVLGPLSLESNFNVTASTTQDSVIYSPRGFATNIPATGARVRLAREGQQDSLSLSTFGTVLRTW